MQVIGRVIVGFFVLPFLLLITPGSHAFARSAVASKVVKANLDYLTFDATFYGTRMDEHGKVASPEKCFIGIETKNLGLTNLFTRVSNCGQ